jgi:hypothetical protein
LRCKGLGLILGLAASVWAAEPDFGPNVARFQAVHATAAAIQEQIDKVYGVQAE